jgi:hypothetical protein
MKRFLFPIIIFAALVFQSCEDVIKVDLGNDNLDLLAVEASITTHDNPKVFLYKAVPVDQSNAYPGISGATVKVSDNGNPSKSIQLVENPDSVGFYTTPDGVNFYGETGKRYTVAIDYQGTKISGTDFLARVEPTDSLVIKPSLRGDNRFLGVFIYGSETPGLGNYYKWDIYINDTLLNETMYMVVASDEMVDGNYIGGFEIFTDYHNPHDKTSKGKLKVGDRVHVRQTSISKEVYYFYYQMMNQSAVGGMFSIPPANIKGNFTSSDSHPVLGIFTARDVSIANEAIVTEEIYARLNTR